MIGRKTRWTREVFIQRALEHGVDLDELSAALGISKSTILYIYQKEKRAASFGKRESEERGQKHRARAVMQTLKH